MTFKEAMKVLESEVECWRLHPEEAYPKALKLGIEALQRILEGRRLGVVAMMGKLPGETED